MSNSKRINVDFNANESETYQCLNMCSDEAGEQAIHDIITDKMDKTCQEMEGIIVKGRPIIVKHLVKSEEDVTPNIFESLFDLPPIPIAT